jgi:hypothetical protein
MGLLLLYCLSWLITQHVTEPQVFIVKACRWGGPEAVPGALYDAQHLQEMTSHQNN